MPEVYDHNDFEDIYQDIEAEVDAGSTDEVTQIKKAVNRAYRKCKRAMIMLNKDWFETEATKAVVADQREYNFSSDWSITDLVKVLAVFDANRSPLTRGSMRSEIGDYYLVGDKEIGFVPTPGGAENYIIKYIARKGDLSATTDTPQFEQLLWDVLFDGGCFYFYRYKKNKELMASYKESFLESFNEFVDFISTDNTGRERVIVEEDECD